MNNIDPIQEELAQAGEASPITPSLLQLDSCRIMTDTEVPEEEFLFRMYGKPCFPRRDISTVTGMEKCGKTIFTSMLMACCAEKDVLELERIREEQLKVMWYDTEQSKQSTKGILTERVKKLVKGDFPEENFFVFNVRACTYEERLELLITGIQTYKPDMVIIDNISDLLPSVNDSEQSSKIIEQLMVLSTEYDCNITVVIHLNRSGEKAGSERRYCTKPTRCTTVSRLLMPMYSSCNRHSPASITSRNISITSLMKKESPCHAKNLTIRHVTRTTDS